MAYEELGKGRKPGTCRYSFFHTLSKGDYRRRQKTCPARDVETIHARWLLSLGETEVGHGLKLFDIIDEYLKSRKGTRSSSYLDDEVRYLERFKEFIGNKDLQAIRRHHAEDFLTHILRTSAAGKKRSACSVNRHRSAVSAFFSWCMVHEWVQGNPMFRLKRHEDGRMYTLTDDEIRQVLETASPYQRQFVGLAVYTGMRKGEILSLRWKQVNFENHIISLEASQTKSKKGRIIPINEPLLRMLQVMKSENLGAEHVVVYEGAPVKCITRSWNTLKKYVPFIKDMRFHDWRHVFASKLRSLGVDLHVIQIILGHSDQRMTQRYANYDGKSLHPHVALMPDYFPPAGGTSAGVDPVKKV